MRRRQFLAATLGGMALLHAPRRWAATPGTGGNTYYLDGDAGNDGHDGLSAGHAWRSLQRLNRQRFGPGDRVLFKRGSHYPGSFRPQGSGSAAQPVLVDAYGSGTAPLLHADGASASTVALVGLQYWTLRNLAISNRGARPAPNRCGIHLLHQDAGVVHGLVLQQLEILDVNGSPIKAQGGGSAIRIEARGQRMATRYQGLHILDNRVARCQRNGIEFLAAGSRTGGLGGDIVVSGNQLSQVPGDGILVRGCEGALVEHNSVRDCGPLPPGEAAAGIWPFDCDRTLIQFNEVSGQQAHNDGLGFDADFRCRDTLIQYNYSHDNVGGMALICNDGRGDPHPGNSGTIVRYNLSINDALARSGSSAVRLSGPVEGAQIYNNIIIVPAKPLAQTPATLFKATSWSGTPSGTAIHDNLLLVAGQPQVLMELDPHSRLSDNHLLGGSVAGTAGLVASDPAKLPASRVQALAQRFGRYRPTMEQAVALLKRAFVDGKPATDIYEQLNQLLASR